MNVRFLDMNRVVVAVFFFMFWSSVSSQVDTDSLEVITKDSTIEEDAVIEKTADKTAEKASQSLDKMFDINPFGGGGKGKTRAKSQDRPRSSKPRPSGGKKLIIKRNRPEQ